MNNWKDNFDYVRDFLDRRAVAQIDNKFGHVDSRGKITTPIFYDNAWDFYNGQAVVEINKGRGFVNKNGKIISGWHDLIKGVFE